MQKKKKHTSMAPRTATDQWAQSMLEGSVGNIQGRKGNYTSLDAMTQLRSGYYGRRAQGQLESAVGIGKPGGGSRGALSSLRLAAGMPGLKPRGRYGIKNTIRDDLWSDFRA